MCLHEVMTAKVPWPKRYLKAEIYSFELVSLQSLPFLMSSLGNKTWPKQKISKFLMSVKECIGYLI